MHSGGSVDDQCWGPDGRSARPRLAVAESFAYTVAAYRHSDHQLRAPRLTARGAWLTGLCFWPGMKWKYAAALMHSIARQKLKKNELKLNRWAWRVPWSVKAVHGNAAEILICRSARRSTRPGVHHVTESDSGSVGMIHSTLPVRRLRVWASVVCSGDVHLCGRCGMAIHVPSRLPRLWWCGAWHLLWSVTEGIQIWQTSVRQQWRIQKFVYGRINSTTKRAVDQTKT